MYKNLVTTVAYNVVHTDFLTRVAASFISFSRPPISVARSPA